MFCCYLAFSTGTPNTSFITSHFFSASISISCLVFFILYVVLLAISELLWTTSFVILKQVARQDSSLWGEEKEIISIITSKLSSDASLFWKNLSTFINKLGSLNLMFPPLIHFKCIVLSAKLCPTLKLYYKSIYWGCKSVIALVILVLLKYTFKEKSNKESYSNIM